jgi:hypothetical protein
MDARIQELLLASGSEHTAASARLTALAEARADARVAAAHAEAKADAERVEAAVAERVEAAVAERVEAAVVQIRYEEFCKQRAMLRRCTRPCRYTEYMFVPPSPGY